MDLGKIYDFIFLLIIYNHDKLLKFLIHCEIIKIIMN